MTSDPCNLGGAAMVTSRAGVAVPGRLLSGTALLSEFTVAAAVLTVVGATVNLVGPSPTFVLTAAVIVLESDLSDESEEAMLESMSVAASTFAGFDGDREGREDLSTDISWLFNRHPYW
jgi:hypothetical protein